MNLNKPTYRTKDRKTPRPVKTTPGHCNCYHCTGQHKFNPIPRTKIPLPLKRILKEQQD